jgi:hypothetical protein
MLSFSQIGLNESDTFHEYLGEAELQNEWFVVVIGPVVVEIFVFKVKKPEHRPRFCRPFGGIPTCHECVEGLPTSPGQSRRGPARCLGQSGLIRVPSFKDLRAVGCLCASLI